MVKVILSALLIWATKTLSAQPIIATQLWSYAATGKIAGSPAIGADGTVYFAYDAPTLCAVTNGGSNKWTFPIQGGIHGASYSPPSVATDGTIFISGGNLYAVNTDGSQKWVYSAGSEAGSPAVGFGNEIYIHGFHLLFSVSITGSFIWSNRIGGSYIFGSPVVTPGGTIYAPSLETASLYAINHDGTEKWQANMGYSSVNSPAIAGDGTIYVTGTGLYAFSSYGTNLWINATNSFENSSPAIGKDGTIYVATFGAGTLYAFTPAGTVKWRTVLAPNNSTNAPIAATPAIDTAGNLYYPVFNTLYALSSTGSVIWTFSPSNGANTYTSPAIGPDGTIYVTFGNTLYAIYNTNKLADAPWPMYRQNARHTGKVEKPSLQKPQKRADANFQFEIYGQVGVTNTIQASPDLSNWSVLAYVVVTNVPTDFIDIDSTNFPSRYYRTLGPPLP